MKKLLTTFLGLWILAVASPSISFAADTPVAAAAAAVTNAVAAAAAAPKPPSVEDRIADLEAYVNNGARQTNAPSNIGGAGPGHNGWMMTSAALVLFMTLPGLALFY